MKNFETLAHSTTRSFHISSVASFGTSQMKHVLWTLDLCCNDKSQCFSCCFSVILIGIAGPSGCGKTTYAKHLAEYLNSPFLPVSLDNFFTSPINIDHPILGRLRSLEQPESININGFLTLLHEIKSQRERAPLQRSNVVMEKNKTIYVVAEGFLLFALSNDVTSMFDIRIFLSSTQDRCRMQRFRRDTRVNPKLHDSQVTITDQFSRWYDNLVWAEYLKRCDLQMANSEKVFKPEEYQNGEYAKLDAYIGKRLKEIV
jgi:uridine kinase